MRRAHLGQDLIQPLQWAMQVDLNPAGGASDILPVVLGAPTLQQEDRTEQNKRGEQYNKHYVRLVSIICLYVLRDDLWSSIER